jgi:hypothetical protein
MTPCIHVLRMPCSHDVKWVRVKLTLLVEYKFCQSFTSTNNLDELEILMQGYLGALCIRISTRSQSRVTD